MLPGAVSRTCCPDGEGRVEGHGGRVRWQSAFFKKAAGSLPSSPCFRLSVLLFLGRAPESESAVAESIVISVILLLVSVSRVVVLFLETCILNVSKAACVLAAPHPVS